MASNNGNKLGGRSWYQYTDDGGQDFAVYLDDDLAAAGGFAAYSGDATDPIKSEYLEMRYVNAVRASNGQRKRIPVALKTEPVYAASNSTAVTVATVSFNISSRIGEKRQLPFNPVTAEPD